MQEENEPRVKYKRIKRFIQEIGSQSKRLNKAANLMVKLIEDPIKEFSELKITGKKLIAFFIPFFASSSQFVSILKGQEIEKISKYSNEQIKLILNTFKDFLAQEYKPNFNQYNQNLFNSLVLLPNPNKVEEEKEEEKKKDEEEKEDFFTQFGIKDNVNEVINSKIFSQTEIKEKNSDLINLEFIFPNGRRIQTKQTIRMSLFDIFSNVANCYSPTSFLWKYNFFYQGIKITNKFSELQNLRNIQNNAKIYVKENVKIKFIFENEEDIYFIINRKMKFENLFKSLAEQKNLCIQALVFTFDGDV